uniref:Gem-associated protein 2 n=1 Tax=Amblyomma maculatum TaxID=34609 RepID=G3MNT0_AMBMU
MSDDDKFESMYRVFPVEDTGEDYDLELPPTTANEYLRRVQIEASSCPDVVVANLDTSKFLGKQTVTFSNSNDCPPPPEGYAPSREWQRKQVYSFHVTRQKIAKRKAVLKQNNEKCPVRLPRIEDKDRWKAICCGSASSGIHPLVSIVTTIQQQKIEAIISYSTQWIEEDGFCASMGKWLYALLACVEKPLHPDICSNIRALARACAAARRKLTSKEDPNLAPLNLIICLIASYFSQTDLADN